MAANRHQTGLTIAGLDNLKRQFDNLGKNFPKPKVRQAARAGMKGPLKEAKKRAPSGATKQLKKGIVAKEEQKWKRQKKLKKAVFQLYFDEAKNSIFQKPLDPATQGSRGGQTRIAHAYYPISQEWGWHYAVGKRTKALHFIKDSVEDTQVNALETVVKHLTKSIEQIANRP